MNNIPEEKKERMIKLFFNTNLKFSHIIKEVGLDGQITIEDLYKILKEYEEKTGIELKRVNKANQVSKADIKKLKAEGLTNEEIVDYLWKKGIYLARKNVETILNRRNDTMEAKTKVNYVPPKKTNLECWDDKIFELREQGYSYNQILIYFFEQGIEDMTDYYVSKRCKEIYSRKGLVEPKTKRRKLELPEEMIFQLRQEGLTYNAICKRLNDVGIKVTESKLIYTCKEIYAKKGMEIPKVKRIGKVEKIISSISKAQDISTESEDTLVREKENEIRKKILSKNIKARLTDKNSIEKALVDLKKSKKATDEQINRIAEVYGIDWNEILINLKEPIDLDDELDK